MKKNLSDLLREEISKETPETGVTTPAKTSRTAKSITPETEATTDTTPLESRIAALELELEKEKILVNNLQEDLQKKQDLETKNNQLSKQLKQSEIDLEKHLQQEKKLEDELKKQKDLVEVVANQLTEAQTKLEDQKHLVEKLYTELLEKQEERSRIEPPSSAPEPEPEPAPEPPRAIVKRQPAKMQYHHIERPVASNKPTAKNLANDTIGWFD